MPFPFKFLCNLLDKLERNADISSNIENTRDRDTRTVLVWFDKHSAIIPRRGLSAVAFLSCLFPERRQDRVFGLQQRKLEMIIQRAQCLGSSRMEHIRRLHSSGDLDFASSVERVMAATDCEPTVGPEFTLEEIDDILDQVAALSPFSSNRLREIVKETHCYPTHVDELLSRVLIILKSSEVKWLIRMLSKNYSPARVPETLAFSTFHFLLPDLLRLQNSIPAAVGMLDEPTIQDMPIQPEIHEQSEFRSIASREFMPRVGIMTTRSACDKARSIKHCCQLAGSRRMSVERKYDGEYCQVHIQLNHPEPIISIFSKSGRDSTVDRAGIHSAVRDSLGLGTEGCKIKKHCILEGELLVWNDAVGRIEPFHKIRSHVQRSGRYIGTSRDPPTDKSEHLMIIFYDILLLDGTSCAGESHDIRRRTLEWLVCRIPGHADVGSREIVRFSSSDAAECLRVVFSRAIAKRWEGLVLKGCDDPYFTLNVKRTSSIKLKKDYIPGLGDSADFVILAGRRDARDVRKCGIDKVWWTSFYIGCLDNKNEVCRLGAKPRLRIIDVVDRNGVSKQDFLHLNCHGYFTQVPVGQPLLEFDIISDPVRRLQPTTLFRIPFIVEVVGASFDKPANSGYYTLRFPRVLKIHADRSLKDTVGFTELQEMAESCLVLPDSQDREEECWLTKLRNRRT